MERVDDPLRKAYIDSMTVTEGLSQASVQQQLQAGTGDMEWDVDGRRRRICRRSRRA